MSVNVRKYCVNCNEEKHATQETLDIDWIPDGCTGHTFRDAVIIDGGIDI